MKERFMKNGVFSLEYDKETLKDMVLTLQEENKQLKDNGNKLKKYLEKIIIDSKAGGNQQYYYKQIYDFVIELEQGSDSNE